MQVIKVPRYIYTYIRIYFDLNDKHPHLVHCCVTFGMGRQIYGIYHMYTYGISHIFVGPYQIVHSVPSADVYHLDQNILNVIVTFQASLLLRGDKVSVCQTVRLFLL